MTRRQIQVLEETVKVVAAHYARKMQAAGIKLTDDELMRGIEENWDTLVSQIAPLSAKASEMLAAEGLA